MFSYRDTREATGPDGTVRRVQVAFTDASTNLQGLGPGFPRDLARVVEATGTSFARMNQVHSDTVTVVQQAHPDPAEVPPTADGLVTRVPGVGLMVRVADCVPILLADVARGVAGAVHSGRPGTQLDIATTAVATLREQGARDLVAWLGPHVCGQCYEVPQALQAEVAARVRGTAATTSWGTPSLDLTGGVVGQLERAGVSVLHVGGCTLEDPALHSYRRSGADSGRLAGLVWFEEELR